MSALCRRAAVFTEVVLILSNRVIINFCRFSRRNKRLHLALFWFAGFLSGILFSLNSNTVSIILNDFFLQKQTAAGLVMVLIFPLLLSVLLISKPLFLYALAFLKSCGIGYSYGAILSFAPASAWLISFFFLFSDILFQPFLYSFWLSHLDGNRERLKKHIIITFLAAVAIACIDIFLISPFLMNIINK